MNMRLYLSKCKYRNIDPLKIIKVADFNVSRLFDSPTKVVPGLLGATLLGINAPEYLPNMDPTIATILGASVGGLGGSVLGNIYQEINK